MLIEDTYIDYRRKLYLPLKLNFDHADDPRPGRESLTPPFFLFFFYFKGYYCYFGLHVRM